MTDDELKRYLEAVEYDIGASLPGAETTYALGQEVLSLRAALRTLRQQSDEYDAVLLFITSMPDDSPQSLARCRRQAHAALKKWNPAYASILADAREQKTGL